MKILIAILATATCCLAAEVAYSSAGPKAQRALLLLPLQQPKASNSSSNTSTTPTSVANGTENLEDVNTKLSERLKQEQGSEQGEYHVYLQDGRLQRVQYITAPITAGQQVQQQQPASDNYKQQQQTPEILSPQFADRRGVYFVQVPQERIQALQANAQQASQQSSQNLQSSAAAQYKQQESFPVNVRYLPLEDSPSSQYREEPSEQTAVPVVRYLPLPLTEQTQEYKSQQSNSGQQAVLQYSEVEPIRGPVYSYSPSAITRILRYAPVY